MSDQETQKQMAERIRRSARQIWLAGLGAYQKAEGDAGKVFEKLVSDGEEIERKTRGVLGKQIKAVEDRVEEVRDRATNTWDKLESAFDQRVSAALSRLGMPTRSELAELREKVAALETRLAASDKDSSAIERKRASGESAKAARRKSVTPGTVPPADA